MRRRRNSSVIHHVRIQCKADKQEETTRKNRNQRQEAKAAVPATEYKANGDDDKKQPKDRSSFKCWSCGEFGHLINSKYFPN